MKNRIPLFVANGIVLVTGMLVFLSLILILCAPTASSVSMSAVPTPYVPQFSFYDWGSLNPNVPAPGQKWDAEYQNIKQLFDAMQARAALIQRDDGFLKSGSVGREQLAGNFAAGVNPPVPWAAFTDYTETDSVMKDGSWYWALVAHTSTGTFDPTKWQFIGTFFSDDPLTLALTKDSLVDGILSSDAAGRLKMADGYVTMAKLGSDVTDVLGAGGAKAWANFSGVAATESYTFTFVGHNITATRVGGTNTTAGSFITFSGETGANAALNGTWPILTANNTTGVITFTISSTPASLIGATASIIQVAASYAVAAISRVSTGKFKVVLTNGTITTTTILAGSVKPNSSNPSFGTVNESGSSFSSDPDTMFVETIGGIQNNPYALVDFAYISIIVFGD